MILLLKIKSGLSPCKIAIFQDFKPLSFPCLTFVLKISYPLKIDEYGNELFINNEGQTYYIRNGDKYDLYMENEYVYTTPMILDTFSDIPIYNTKKEVPKN